jgi:hypothetical protein
MLTLERLKTIAEQAERHLADWGLRGVAIDCETDSDDFVISVVDDTKPFVETFAIVRQDGWMSIDLNPRNHMVIKVGDWDDQDLSLMFAFSALSNLLSHKTGWLPLTDTSLILSWGYDRTENAWAVEVLAIKGEPYTDPPSTAVELTLNVTVKGKRAALRGLLCGDDWDVTLKQVGDFDTMMRALVGVVLAFVGCGTHHSLKEANHNDRQGRF